MLAKAILPNYHRLLWRCQQNDGTCLRTVISSNMGDNGDVTIFLSSGDGTFRKGQMLTPGNNPSSVIAPDLNADHRPDLVVTNQADSTVAILFGNSDVSEPACPNGTDPYITDIQCGDATLPLHGCYAYSLFGLNDQKCVDSTGGQGDHDFVVFRDGTFLRPNYWIAGEDPADCANADGDCNLTIVKVIPVFSN
jgi:FG-GAP-like repeat